MQCRLTFDARLVLALSIDSTRRLHGWAERADEFG
jgi:hypothetical protein